MDPSTLLLLVQLSGCDPDRDWRCAAQGPIRRQEEPQRRSDVLNPFKREPVQPRPIPESQAPPVGRSFDGFKPMSPGYLEKRKEFYGLDRDR